MDQEDRRAPRAPIRAARQLHTRGDPSTPGYMNWDSTDGVWRNDRGETQEEGRARQAQKEEAARALCKPTQHSAPARQQHHHPMCPLLVHRINAFPQYSHGLCVAQQQLQPQRSSTTRRDSDERVARALPLI